MARPASDIEQIEAALLSMKLATSADELRIAQAVAAGVDAARDGAGRWAVRWCHMPNAYLVLCRSNGHTPERPAQDGPAQSGQIDIGARGGSAGQSHARCQSGWCGHHPAPATVD